MEQKKSPKYILESVGFTKKENILVYKCGSDIGICRLDKLDRLKCKIDKFLEEMGSNN